MARPITTLALLALLSACGGEGVTPQDNPPQGGNPVSTYSGPAPANSDVQAFRLSVWDALREENRCGNCHSERGGQEPLFVRSDDVNLAYQVADDLIDPDTPALSLLATKVGGGHNCWTSSDAACADIITRLIGNWVGDAASGPGKQIVLTAPPLLEVGDSKSFPRDDTGFRTHIHGLLTSFCAECHSEAAETPQAPYFANADSLSAYDAARARINLDDPAKSRLVVRLGEEFHNCWSGDCDADAVSMRDAIQDYADEIPLTEVDERLVLSKALGISDGLVAAGADRQEQDAIAIWEFKTGRGGIAFDTSGVEPAIDLRLTDTGWVGGYGIEFKSPTGRAQATTGASSKLYDLIRATGEYTIEAWVVPANVTQEGPARIISYSGSVTSRNFTLGQSQYNYNFLARSSDSDGNGEPALSTADADQVLQATQQHVVLTYDAVNGRRIYVNGAFTGVADPLDAGGFEDWDNTFALTMGNEVSGNRPWAGKLRMVAIHNRVLSDAQIIQNFEAGVGQKYFLLFSVAGLVEPDDAYLMFEVSQFDDFSYLFSRPTYVVLNATGTPPPIDFQGIRIGINGKEATVGQAFARVSGRLGGDDYGDDGQLLSELGAVIALEKGPDGDQFFVSFDSIGLREFERTDSSTLISLASPDVTEPPDMGLRVFDEINASMSAMTGVSSNEPEVALTFDTIRQQLPTVETIDGFLSAHQIAIAQLAIEYCNALVDTESNLAVDTPDRYFPGFDLSAPASAAFATSVDRAVMLNPLLDRILDVNPTTAPVPAPAGAERDEVLAELDALVVRLTSCGVDCAADRTATVTKAACSALLGSAVSLLQ